MTVSKEIVLKDANVPGMPAAQYIRMSTEHQRYSPDNQKAAIASFAASRGYDVVATYFDDGKSGLTLAGRPALKQLLRDVLSGKPPFEAVLVLDVSRWGRFQDTDQSAHYEYMCRAAGVQIHYCEEPFENDGGPLSSIMKSMKRVMAAEFSRELSAKTSRAQRQQARLGFRQGGAPPYGTRRQVVDENGHRKMILKKGQTKALSTDRVIYTLGPTREVEVVRLIFQRYAVDRVRPFDIVKELNGKRRKQSNGEPWTVNAVRGILRNEIYVGTFVFGRRLCNLGRPIWFDNEDWIRVPVLQPVVPMSLFKAAAKRMREITEARMSLNDDEMIRKLRQLLEEKGRLSYSLLYDCPYTPHPANYTRRFGSLSAAYAQVGYVCPANFKTNADGTKISDEQLLDDLRRLYAKLGHITIKDINADPHSEKAHFYDRRFGGILNAYRLAGIPYKFRSRRDEAAWYRQQVDYETKLPRKKPMIRNTDGSRFTNKQLLQLVRGLLRKHGYLSHRLIDDDPSVPTVQFFRDRFGGLKALYARIGYECTQSELNRSGIMRTMARLDAATSAAAASITPS